MDYYYEYYDGCNEKREEKEEFIRNLTSILYEEKNKVGFLELVILCVGTDKVTGDCLGPLVGTKLKELLSGYNIFNINIYGTLDNNISYINAKTNLNMIKKMHPNAYIIVVDAALSKRENIGKIFINQKETVLGRGLNKNKIKVGRLSIKGVVGENHNISKYNFYSLRNTSLNTVINLANIIAEGIVEVIKYT